MLTLGLQFCKTKNSDKQTTKIVPSSLAVQTKEEVQVNIMKKS